MTVFGRPNTVTVSGEACIIKFRRIYLAFSGTVVIEDYSLPWYAILGIAIGVPLAVIVVALYCIKFGYRWTTIYTDAKKAAKIELTVDVDRENDISFISGKRSYPELATGGVKKSVPTTEILDELPGFSEIESVQSLSVQKSTMVTTGYIQFGLLPETTSINSNESIEPCPGYVPLEGILKQQNNRQESENKN